MPSEEEADALSPSRLSQEREVEREVVVLGGPAEAAEVAELRRWEQALDSREEGEARSEYPCEAEAVQRKPVRSADSPSAAAAEGPPHLVPLPPPSSDQAPVLDWTRANSGAAEEAQERTANCWPAAEKGRARLLAAAGQSAVAAARVLS